MADIFDFPFRRRGENSSDAGISVSDFINRCRHHLAGYAIAHDIALNDVDLFSMPLREAIERNNDFNPLQLLKMLGEPECYKMLEENFLIFRKSMER